MLTEEQLQVLQAIRGAKIVLRAYIRDLREIQQYIDDQYKVLKKLYKEDEDDTD